MDAAQMNGTDDEFPALSLPSLHLPYSPHVDTTWEEPSSGDALDRFMPPVDGDPTRLPGTTPPSVHVAGNDSPSFGAPDEPPPSATHGELDMGMSLGVDTNISFGQHTVDEGISPIVAAGTSFQWSLGVAVRSSDNQRSAGRFLAAKSTAARPAGEGAGPTDADGARGADAPGEAATKRATRSQRPPRKRAATAAKDPPGRTCAGLPWRARDGRKSAAAATSDADADPQDPWETKFRLLQEYNDEHGHAAAATSDADADPQDPWETKFCLLQEYKDEHGDCGVRQKFKTARGAVPLGTWVNKQRTEERKLGRDECTTLTREKCARLEALGFEWAQPKGQASWNLRFEEFKDYKEKHGHCHVPTKFKDNTALGRWVTSQRADRKSGAIDQNNEKKLNDVGFAWAHVNKK